MAPSIALDYAVALAYVALLFDMALQIRRVTLRKSSGDISIVGVVVRTLASIVFMLKYVYMQDPLLTIGQSLLLTLLAIYVFLIIWYRIGSISAHRKEI